MAVVTKIKVYPSGKIEAGEFIEAADAKSVSLKPDSTVTVSELDESGDSVKFGADGKLVSKEIVEV